MDTRRRAHDIVYRLAARRAPGPYVRERGGDRSARLCRAKFPASPRVPRGPAAGRPGAGA
jgi:hypothetical protein